MGKISDAESMLLDARSTAAVRVAETTVQLKEAEAHLVWVEDMLARLDIKRKEREPAGGDRE